MTDINKIIDKVLEDSIFIWPVCRICEVNKANYDHKVCQSCYGALKRLKNK